MTDLTILLPTHRRPDSLARLLSSLDRLEDPGCSWDVLVVDNDPEGGARDQVLAATVQGRPARYVHETTPGAAHARNRGIAEAEAALLAMVDDDVEVRPDWLRLLLAPLLDGRADLAGGRVVLDPDVPRPAWLDEPVVGAYLTNFDLDADAPGPGTGARPLRDDEFVVTASCVVRRDLAVASGGFASGLGPTGGRQLVGDDVQFVRAVRAVGGRAWWVPQAVVVHELPPQRLDRRWILQRAYLQGRTDWLLDREELSSRRLNGSRVAATWLRHQVGLRNREGWGAPDVRFHAACDIARTVGRLVEAAAWGWRDAR